MWVLVDPANQEASMTAYKSVKPQNSVYTYFLYMPASLRAGAGVSLCVCACVCVCGWCVCVCVVACLS